jgi:ribulose bisphosphate carboxylase small subunit
MAIQGDDVMVPALAELVRRNHSEAGRSDGQAPLILGFVVGYVYVDDEGAKRLGWEVSDDLRTWEARGILAEVEMYVDAIAKLDAFVTEDGDEEDEG